MKNAFIFGLVAGLAATFGLAFAAPFLAQERVRSETRVENNGGRLEFFEIDFSKDTLVQAPGVESEAPLVPGEVSWFADLAPFTGLAAVYRLRNESGVVIGTASRVRGLRADEDVEWVLHIPPRGTLILSGISIDSAEAGEIRAGLGEFGELAGDWQAQLDEDSVWRFRTSVRTRMPSDDLPPEDEIDETQDAELDSSEGGAV